MRVDSFAMRRKDETSDFPKVNRESFSSRLLGLGPGKKSARPQGFEGILVFSSSR
jgi:hypothetical protein